MDLNRVKSGAAFAIGGSLLAYALTRRATAFALPPKHASVFITGCDTGIGRATAILLHQRGMRVFAGVMSDAAGQSLQKEIGSAGSDRFAYLVCDVTKEKDVAAAAEKIGNEVKEQGLWAVVNNAGISTAAGPVEFVPMHRVRKTIEVNLFGIYNVLQKFLPLVRKARGRVVNVASINGFVVWRNHSPYCVSKFGVVALTNTLRQELYHLNMSVSCIAPGGTNTDIFQSGFRELKTTLEEMDKQYGQVYGEVDLDKITEGLKVATERILVSPFVIAEAIHHAIADSHPKQTYFVGRGSSLLAAVKAYLPQSWMSGITHRTLDVQFNPTKPLAKL